VLANANITCAGGCPSVCSNGHAGSFAPAAILTAAALPAVTNPSQTSPAIVAAATQGGRTLPAITNPSLTLPATVAAATHGGWIGGAVIVAIGGPLTASSATGASGTAMVGEGDRADRARASVKEQRARGHFVPCLCTEAELCAENPQLQWLTNANSQLCSMYGDTIHQNDGAHLDGGIGVAEDAKWQRLYLWVAACNLLLYNSLNSRWANWFLETLTGL
jgi:hypothetical protein